MQGRDASAAVLPFAATPRTLRSRGVGAPSKYVLEVPGGWTQKAGVLTGSTVEFEGLSGIRVVP